MGKIHIFNGKITIFNGKIMENPLLMTIFNSYVKLPEGMFVAKKSATRGFTLLNLLGHPVTTTTRKKHGTEKGR